MANDADLIQQVTPAHVMAESQLAVQRALTDQISLLNRSVTTLSADFRSLSGEVRGVRESVVRLEAQDFKNAIRELRVDQDRRARETAAAFGKVIEDVVSRLEKLDGRHTQRMDDLEGELGVLKEETLPNIKTEIVELRGKVLPISIGITAILTGIVTALVSHIHIP